MSSMREDLLDFIKANIVDGFKVSEELPWQKDGNALYLKNFKYVYVSRPQTTQEPLFDTFDGGSAVNEITSCSAYFSTDAKTIPPGYDDLVSKIKLARLDDSYVGAIQKATLVSTEYVGDALVTQLDISYKTLILNS